MSVEKRRFPRVHIQRSLAEVITALQAQIAWPNHEISEILDLSYKGMAVRKPGMFPLAAQGNVRVQIELGGMPPFMADARVAWANLDWVGLEIAALDADGHTTMHEYLDAKLVGARLRPVERALHNPKETFKYWYQAPGVHVFIWLNSEGLVDRATVHVAEDVVEFTRGRKFGRVTARERRAFLLLSQMDKPDHPMEEFVRTLETGD